jgi:hypothetical protein
LPGELTWELVATAAGLSGDLSRRCDEAVASALRPERFQRSGRCGWQPQAGGQILKLKGIGSWRGPGSVPQPPSTTPYLRAHAHFGFGDDGRPRIVDSLPAPFGGITVGRAMREYEVGSALYRVTGWGMRPLRVYQLVRPRLRFPDASGEPLGAVVSLMPGPWPHRADTLFGSAACLGPDALEFAAAAGRGRGLAQTVAGLSGGYGLALRDLTETGVFRHSGSLDNWGVATGQGRVFLTDLDSCQWLEQAALPRRAREVLRDVASGVFNLATSVMLPGMAAEYAHGAIGEACPFTALAAGFFPEAPAEAAARAVEPFLRYWRPLAERSWSGAGARVAGSERAVWMDRDLAYCLLIAGLAPVYEQSKLASRWEDPARDALAAALCGFLGHSRAARFRQFLGWRVATARGESLNAGGYR